MRSNEEHRGGGTWGWVALVVVIGLVAGGLLSLYAVPPRGPPPAGANSGPIPLARVATILSGLDLALLLALVFVYVRTYLETRARFALGLVVFLIALLVQIVTSSPAIFAAFGQGAGGLGPFVLVATLFEAIALTVFLGLSLE
jgi:hypothetical protein